MRRASLERSRTMREWQARSDLDFSLEAGHYRKGRRASGCPRVCVYCRTKKLTPSRQELRAQIAFDESVALLR